MPDFSLADVTLNWQEFKVITQYDMLVAHFTAKHFKRARELLESVFFVSN